MTDEQATRQLAQAVYGSLGLPQGVTVLTLMQDAAKEIRRLRAGPQPGFAPELDHQPCCHQCIIDRDWRDPNTGLLLNATMFLVCPECGNKRCPRANNHQFTCTGSNAPGQPGSRV